MCLSAMVPYRIQFVRNNKRHRVQRFVFFLFACLLPAVYCLLFVENGVPLYEAYDMRILTAAGFANCRI